MTKPFHDCSKKALVVVVVDDAIKLAHVMFYMSKDGTCCSISRTMTSAQFCSLVCRVLAAVQLLPSPQEAVVDTQPKHQLSSWWSSCATVNNSTGGCS